MRFLISALVIWLAFVEVLDGLFVEDETLEMAESIEELRGILRTEGVVSLLMEDEIDTGESGGDWPICSRYALLPTRATGFMSPLNDMLFDIFELCI